MGLLEEVNIPRATGALSHTCSNFCPCSWAQGDGLGRARLRHHDLPWPTDDLWRAGWPESTHRATREPWAVELPSRLSNPEGNDDKLVWRETKRERRRLKLQLTLGALFLMVGSALAGAFIALSLDRDDTPLATLTTTTAVATSVAPATVAPQTTIDPDLPVTFEVEDEASWKEAISQVRPGDSVLLTSTINSRLEYRGTQRDGVVAGASGTEDLPIRITALPDVWIDPGDLNNNSAALDLQDVDFVIIDGIQVRNSQFGIRLINVSGSALTPAGVVNSVVTDIGHSAIAVQADFNTLEPSSDIVIDGNIITNTGLTNSRFGEGVYVGSGSANYIDETHDVRISRNQISQIGAEAVDIKPGTRDILVEQNWIFDLAPIDGGAISAHYASVDNPKPQELDQITIRDNRIWNQNLDSVPGSNDWAIWVGHGGVTIEDNIIWGLRDQETTRAVRIRALADFGPHPIVVRNNVFWSFNGVMAEGQPSGSQNLLAENNVGPAGATGADAVEPDYFAYPVPPPGERDDADAGDGPGSAFQPG